MTLKTTESMQSVIEIREMMNQGRIAELNALVADDFFAVFSLGKPGEYETYDAKVYRLYTAE